MHTLVLHSRTHTPPRLVLTSIQSLHPPSLPYIYIYIYIPYIYISIYLASYRSTLSLHRVLERSSS